MNVFIRVMKALSGPNRVRMVQLLGCGEPCVRELQDLLGSAQSTVSKYVKILEEAGFLPFARKDPGLFTV